MPGVPVMLNVAGRRCLVIGGGRVGWRRSLSLHQAGAAVTLIAPEVSDDLRELPIEIHERSLEPGDLRDWFLIVVATDDAAAGELVARHADGSTLINRADESSSGNIDFMAADRRGPLTVAVHTDGVSAAAAALIRTELGSAIDPAWSWLLELAAPYRARVRAAFPSPDERTARLRRLTDPVAFAILKGSGEAAFREHCEAVATPG